MRITVALNVVLLAAVPALCADIQPSHLHHRLSVQLNPSAHRLQVVDRITFAEGDVSGSESVRFVLHAGLEPSIQAPGWRLEAAGPASSSFLGINATTSTVADTVPLEGWILQPSSDAPATVEVHYSGVIHHPLATAGEEYQRSFSETPGTISDEGVFLAGTSFWVPTFGDQLVTFDLEVAALTPPWDVVSQGRRVRHMTGHDVRVTSWSCPHPTEEIYLIAGPWHEYSGQAGDVEVFAFLRDEDPGLATRYLEATKRYLKLYQGMLPEFPFESFALVENFWETGYGMPGFTLLGPQVIRFPWILTSSYPHELLHNWWGNSAYVDFDTGNWCEGLTAYLADHLFAEQKGTGATHRRATLKKFTDFVASADDFVLAEFTSRRSAASEAVGYGKSLMLFHMVRREIGDAAFLEAMSRFYENGKFRRVGFADIAEAVTVTTGKDWEPFISEWTQRLGAPEIELGMVSVAPLAERADEWIVDVELRQRQDDVPFPISIPIVVTVEGRAEPVVHSTGMCDRSCRVQILCPGRPLRLDIDPGFDVMRRLDPLEVPPALSTLLGADDPLYVLPSEAPQDEIEAWRELAAAWAKPSSPRIMLDNEVEDLGAESVWILGWTNRFGQRVAEGLNQHPVKVEENALQVAGKLVERDRHSLVLVARGESDPASALGWVTAAPTAAIPGLARKIPHYSRYSYLAFQDEAPDNMLKGMWQPVSSPLVRKLTDGEMVELKQPSRTPLVELPPRFDSNELLKTVEILAAPEMEGRGLGSEGLERATHWVEERLRSYGLEPVLGESFRQTWTWRGGDPARDFTLANLVAKISGRNPDLADDPVIVLAHLDHLGTGWPDARQGNSGRVHPGADDNASGVAVVLELAKTLATEPARARPVVFGVVTGEEAGLIGSRHLLASLSEVSSPSSCVNFDTVGRLRDGKLFVLNAATAREWRYIFMGVGHTVGTPIEVVQEPLDSSDQVACIEQG
ncbi:MAG: M20/M25/M40 family metallo-hydrolase, partial [bacterium]|nr:M20/M25/M40 family metallo-hydrolase [bacterium]